MPESLPQRRSPRVRINDRDGSSGRGSPRWGRRRQRLHDPRGHRERFRFTVVQQRLDALDLSDGRPRVREEYVPLEHRRPAHLVHHPREQGRLDRAEEGSGHHGLHERADRPGGCGSAAARRPLHLRRAAEPQGRARRRAHVRGSVQQAGHGAERRLAPAQAADEHDLRRDRGRAAGDRPQRDRGRHQQAVQGEDQGHHPERGRHRQGAGLRAEEPAAAGALAHRADERHRRQDHHRR